MRITKGTTIIFEVNDITRALREYFRGYIGADDCINVVEVEGRVIARIDRHTRVTPESSDG